MTFEEVALKRTGMPGQDFSLQDLEARLQELEVKLSASYDDWETIHLARIVIRALREFAEEVDS